MYLTVLLRIRQKMKRVLLKTDYSHTGDVGHWFAMVSFLTAPSFLSGLF